MGNKAKTFRDMDGGWKSRKLWFAVFAVGALFLGAGLGAKYASFAPMYETLAGSIVAVCALLFTGTVANKYVASKAAASLAETTNKDDVLPD